MADASPSSSSTSPPLPSAATAAASSAAQKPRTQAAQARWLRKKIREVSELRARADRGAGAPLDAHQRAKVASEAGLRRSLFDLTGEEPFRGPAADSVLGERLIDVLGIVAAMGFAAEVSHCLYLCGETWRKGDRGATNVMLARSLERQCGARAARAAKREDFVHPVSGSTFCGTTQLMRAAELNNLPRVLQLVQLGAPLELKNKIQGWTALHWASWRGREHVARLLLDGKYESRGAAFDARGERGWTPLMWASYKGHEGVVRLLLARGARQELHSSGGRTALYLAVQYDDAGTVALLCAAPGAAAAFALRYRGQTPLGLAIERSRAASEAVLRAHGASA
jgi:hypothetical protein